MNSIRNFLETITPQSIKELVENQKESISELPTSPIFLRTKKQEEKKRK